MTFNLTSPLNYKQQYSNSSAMITDPIGAVVDYYPTNATFINYLKISHINVINSYYRPTRHDCKALSGPL